MISPIEENALKLSRRANMRVFLLWNGCRALIVKDLPSHMSSKDKKPGIIACGFACELGGKTL